MSTITHFNPDSIYGFDSASTGSVLTKGSSSSITFQNISAIVPSNVSYFTNDAGYINSGVTAMTYYATSADVVNRFNSLATVATSGRLSTLSDVTINNPSNGQVLTYSASSWVNSTIDISIYATKTYVDDSIMSIDDTIYISGTGTGPNLSSYSISRTNDELYKLIVSSNTRINAVLMFKETSGSPVVPMLCKSYQKSVTNNGDDVSITLDFISTLVADSSYTLLKECMAQVILGLTKIYDGNYNFIGYGATITVFGGTGLVGGIVPKPGFASSGQLLSVSSAGTYELISIVNSENIPY